MIDGILKDTKTKMQKAVEATKDEFVTICTRRANAAMFDGTVVEYYGSPTPLKRLTSLNIPEARTVIIRPFDRNATQDIIRAISESDLGVTPTDDGKTIRVMLPALTEDRRKEHVKQARTKAEEGRVSTRGIRRKARDTMEALKKDKTLGEDEVERGVKELDTITKKFTDEVDALLEDEETGLMTVQTRQEVELLYCW